MTVSIPDISGLFSADMTTLIVAVIVLVVALIIKLLIAKKFGSTARDKGYKFATHFLLCFFFGFIGWIAVCALPDKRTRKVLEKIEKGLFAANEQTDFYQQ